MKHLQLKLQHLKGQIYLTIINIRQAVLIFTHESWNIRAQYCWRHRFCKCALKTRHLSHKSDHSKNDVNTGLLFLLLTDILDACGAELMASGVVLTYQSTIWLSGVAVWIDNCSTIIQFPPKSVMKPAHRRFKSGGAESRVGFWRFLSRAWTRRSGWRQKEARVSANQRRLSCSSSPAATMGKVNGGSDRGGRRG